MKPEERENILDQHKQVYDGYVTRYNQESNMTPLWVQDLANDKNGITINNKGVVSHYKNMGINESSLDMIGDGPTDLENGTVDLDGNDDQYISLGRDMELNNDEFEYDIDELEDYSSEDMDEGFDDFDIKRKRGGVDYSEEEFPDSNKIDAKTFDFGFGDEFTHDGNEERFDFEEVDEEVLPDFMEKLNESLNMFERFKKYN
jgi:hypothetical protein